MRDVSFEISIQTDNDGFGLFKCQRCGELFKLRPSDIEDDEIVELYCPLCGLTSDSYITEDVIELAQTKATNCMHGMLQKEFKDLERKTRGSMIPFKTKGFQEEVELPIRYTIDSMEITEFECCGRDAKIRHMLNFSGCHCPFCGEIKDEYN